MTQTALTCQVDWWTAGGGGSPDGLPIETLRERAWQVVEPRYLARLAGLVEAFGSASSHELGSDEVNDVAEAAARGRVATR